ncbi:MAG: ABC transporter substrate-binding protein [Nitrosomonadales bacterium]|nr:MAG: ABC transporter substrate-binding protein [Nitrosomonadales bacterium]
MTCSYPHPHLSHPLEGEGAKTALRIVSQSPYITLQLEWLGLKACIVGASRDDTGVQAADTGGVMDPDGAAIAALRPDLMITSVWTKAARWAALTPPGTRALRLESFQSMAQIEANLREIGQAAAHVVDLANIEARVQAFAQGWRDAAAAINATMNAAVNATINAQGRRVVLLSHCSGRYYAYGRDTWLHDLFSTAGFVVVETHTGVRLVPLDDSPEGLSALLTVGRAATVFYLRRCSTVACERPLPEGVPVAVLNGDLFLHPAPCLIAALDSLLEDRSW